MWRLIYDLVKKNTNLMDKILEKEKLYSDHEAFEHRIVNDIRSIEVKIYQLISLKNSTEVSTPSIPFKSPPSSLQVSAGTFVSPPLPVHSHFPIDDEIASIISDLTDESFLSIHDNKRDSGCPSHFYPSEKPVALFTQERRDSGCQPLFFPSENLTAQIEAGPSCLQTPSNYQQAFNSPDVSMTTQLPIQAISPSKFKSVHEVILQKPNLTKVENIGRLAIELAVHTYFGEGVLKSSTISGRLKGYNQLNPEKLSQLRSAVKNIVQSKNKVSDQMFEDMWKNTCLVSISNKCKKLRQYTCK